MKIFLIIECETCNLKKEVEAPIKLTDIDSFCEEAQITGIRLVEESENELKNAEKRMKVEKGEKVICVN